MAGLINNTLNTSYPMSVAPKPVQPWGFDSLKTPTTQGLFKGASVGGYSSASGTPFGPQGGTGFSPSQPSQSIAPATTNVGSGGTTNTSGVAPAITSGGGNSDASAQLEAIKKQALDLQNGVKGLVPPPATTPPAVDPTSYAGYVGRTANAGTPSDNQQQSYQNVNRTAQGNQGLIDRANQINDLYQGKISEIGRLGAGAVAGDMSTGSNVVGSGNANLASTAASARMNALSNEQQQQTNTLNSALTGQNQMATAYGAGLTGANTQQANQITALSNAAGYSKPTVEPFGQTAFDPLTQQFSGQGNLPAGTMEQYAQMAASGQYAAIPSSITSNPALSAQLNAAATKINPSFSPITSSAQGNVLASLPAMESASTAAEGIKNTITNYLSQNPTLNSSDIAAGNLAQQWVEGKQLADPKYQTLFNYLNEYTNTLAPILGVGGSPTNLKTEIANSFLNAAASGKSISEVLNNMSSLTTNKIKDLKAGALGGSTSVPQSSSTGGGQVKRNADGTLQAVSF